MSYWLQSLNPEQAEAASHDHGPLLILAGAGSGKTTVLVSRTGRLIAERLTTPERICVLTFTNKAAQELKARVAKKLGSSAAGVWSGTFHGFGLQFLKEHWKEAELPKKFGIIDGGDGLAILKDLVKDHQDYDKSRLNLEILMAKISHIRTHGRDEKLDQTPEGVASVVLAPKYVKRLRNLGVVDFEELLLRPLKMMKESVHLRQKMQKRFDFIMVDEFQDTNATQMLLIDELTASHRNIAVVGDDDQSIYGWRGAEIQNILGFPKRYDDCKVIRLERNYRSTGKILNLANAIIARNTARHTKVLRPGREAPGEMPELFVFANEEAEVDQVVRELMDFHKKGYAFGDMAILYRSNSQGGLMEGGLRRNQIPYKLTGGTALFDRKEAKDVLAFIRSSIYPTEVSFRRVINLPARGIGDKTLEDIEATGGQLPFHVKAKLWAENNPDEKASFAIKDFMAFLEHLKTELVMSKHSAEDVLNTELRNLGYRDYVNKSYRDLKAADSRWLSVTILGRILDGMFTRQGRTTDTLENFITCMELRDQVDEEDEKDEVQMMTLHACKGLEFPLVFLLGLEEDLLPHARLGQNTDEERRLFYVGVTRAQKHLVLTRVRQRKRYGQLQDVAPSRFLLELDTALYQQHIDGRPLVAGARESMLKDLMSKLDKKIAARDLES
ncbi:MAG TPA: ATP-dependent helicase [Bdellovibrionales bacterium]|nr:ATP-dependent helicase [Bdellovibrionales bacterium]